MTSPEDGHRQGCRGAGQTWRTWSIWTRPRSSGSRPRERGRGGWWCPRWWGWRRGRWWRSRPPSASARRAARKLSRGRSQSGLSASGPRTRIPPSGLVTWNIECVSTLVMIKGQRKSIKEHLNYVNAINTLLIALIDLCDCDNIKHN